jgi:7-keto-8-aminopelargonate synthetase-like enzyme
VTESVFSVDGDRAPLRELIGLKKRFSALLLLDEAHALGVVGANGRGLAHETGLTRHVDVQMGTLGKALGVSGGYVCGSHSLIDWLINRARPFIFSTAPPPAFVAAATAAIEFLQSDAGEERRRLLWERIQTARTLMNFIPPPPPVFAERSASSPPPAKKPNVLRQLLSGVGPGQATGAAPEVLTVRAETGSAIHPIVVGDEQVASDLSRSLQNEGFLVPAIRYPTVAKGAARLRITITAAHEEPQIRALAEAINRLRPETLIAS